MPTNWPTSLDDGTSLPTKVDGDDITVAETNTQSGAIKGVEASLGVPASPAAGSTNQRLNAHDHDGSDGESASVRIGAEFVLKGVSSPAQITADQNNYAITNLNTISVVRLSTDALRNITGFVAPTNSWKILLMQNIGTFNIVLKNANASSTAANRFAFGADITIVPGQGLILLYDGTQSRWVNPGASITDHATLTNVTADQHHADVHARNKHTTAVRVQDEGGTLTDILDFNFTGAGVTASFAAGVATVTIPGGSGSPGTLADLQDVAVTESITVTGRYAEAGHAHAHGAAKNPNDHHNQSHSIGDHIDIDRSIRFAADMWGSTGTKGALSTSQVRFSPMADAATSSIRIAFFIPDNWVSGMDLTVYWVPDTTVTGGVKWRMQTLYFAPTESANASFTTTDPTVNSAVRTVDILQAETFTMAAGYAAGDMIQLQLQRLGSDAGDTYNGGIAQVIQLKFTYTGDQ